MTKIPTKIDGAWLLQPRIFGDARGFFIETWNRETFRSIGIDVDFIQDNHSRSAKNVLRGLHYQIGEDSQGKLVWVTSGAVFDVLVDLRKNSPTFGAWDGYVLSAETHERIWVPTGCAHGFLVLSEVADFHYKCTRLYSPASERCIRFDDPSLGVEWPLAEGAKPIVSEKDRNGETFAECEKFC